jgi:hypothetical protein
MQIDITLAQMLQSVEQNGLCVEKEVRDHSVTDVDMVFSHVIIIMCMRGSARVMFDMQEISSTMHRDAI